MQVSFSYHKFQHLEEKCTNLNKFLFDGFPHYPGDGSRQLIKEKLASSAHSPNDLDELSQKLEELIWAVANLKRETDGHN